jgi:uncharacterized membrane protein YbjE (DUF340 family)
VWREMSIVGFGICLGMLAVGARARYPAASTACLYCLALLLGKDVGDVELAHVERVVRLAGEGFAVG